MIDAMRCGTPHRGAALGRPAVRLLAAVAAVLLLGLPAAVQPVQAKTLRVASAFDPQTMDPHALALLYHTRVVTQIYEGLVNRDRNFALQPSLAVSWQMLDPTTWRFRLRPGVTFHDGSPFTADDAVFSIERALATTSQRRFGLRGVVGASRVDDLTIDVRLEAPDAVLPEKFWLVAMMSRAWATRHGVQRPQDFNARQETHAVRHANGTGPFELERYETDKVTVLRANPRWWGRAAADTGNLAEAHLLVIQSDATRLAALASGEVDLVIDPPFQDVARLRRDARLAVAEITDIGTQYLTFDQQRDELQFSDVRGRNPFRDLRVRQAVAHAIDVELIIRKVLRGQARAAGSFVSPLVDGYVEQLDRRLPFDPGRARALLREAGYPDGFGVTLDCVNISFREAVCQAIAAMLTQVGIRTQLAASPSALFFPKLSQAQASFVEYGWTPGIDPWATFHALFRSFDGKGAGAFNAGRYSNPQVDALIDALRVEPDLQKRRQMVGQTLRLLHADLPYVPLYRRSLTWVMRRGVTVVPWPNDVLELRWVRVQ